MVRLYPFGHNLSVPEPAILISKNDPASKKGGSNPRKLPLHEFDRRGLGHFQIHEVGYVPLGMRWHYDRLCNSFWRFYYNGASGSHVEMEGRKIPLLPDQAMVIPENTLFNSRGAPGVPHLWIHFSPPLSARFAAERFTVPLDPALAATIAALQERLIGGRETRGERQQIFHACLAVIHSCFSRAPLRETPPLPAALSLIQETIEQSLAAPPSNQALARQAGMSVEGFSRWFKRHLGLSPARYVVQRRIREACRLLSLTDRSIEEVAETVGFANRHHFSRVFRRQTGRGPARFRRDHAASLP